MLGSTIRRALGRRKIETASIVTLAALAAVGFSRHEATAGPLAALRSADAVTANVASAADLAVATERRGIGFPDLEHPRVDSWVKKFTTTYRASFDTYLQRMNRYDDMITAKLANRGMPEGLIYLAMIESGFNPDARSPVRARGLWQFMSGTGRQYGLRVSRRVDERTNPAKSTDAALEYLSDLHEQFGSWYLAAAAYNTGPGRVQRIMKQVTGQTRGSDADYYRISGRLPRETREYVPKLVAAARIASDPARYGFSAAVEASMRTAAR